jgi:hypothetical protein
MKTTQTTSPSDHLTITHTETYSPYYLKTQEFAQKLLDKSMHSAFMAFIHTNKAIRHLFHPIEKHIEGALTDIHKTSKAAIEKTRFSDSEEISQMQYAELFLLTMEKTRQKHENLGITSSIFTKVAQYILPEASTSQIREKFTTTANRITSFDTKPPISAEYLPSVKIVNEEIKRLKDVSLLNDAKIEIEAKIAEIRSKRIFHPMTTNDLLSNHRIDCEIELLQTTFKQNIARSLTPDLVPSDPSASSVESVVSSSSYSTNSLVYGSDALKEDGFVTLNDVAKDSNLEIKLDSPNPIVTDFFSITERSSAIAEQDSYNKEKINKTVDVMATTLSEIQTSNKELQGMFFIFGGISLAFVLTISGVALNALSKIPLKISS